MAGPHRPGRPRPPSWRPPRTARGKRPHHLPKYCSVASWLRPFRPGRPRVPPSGKSLHGPENPSWLGQSVFRHQLILKPTADRHHLAEQFFHGLLLEAVVRHGLHRLQLLSPDLV